MYYLACFSCLESQFIGCFPLFNTEPRNYQEMKKWKLVLYPVPNSPKELLGKSFERTEEKRSY